MLLKGVTRSQTGGQVISDTTWPLAKPAGKRSGHATAGPTSQDLARLSWEIAVYVGAGPTSTPGRGSRA